MDTVYTNIYMNMKSIVDIILAFLKILHELTDLFGCRVGAGWIKPIANCIHD